MRIGSATAGKHDSDKVNWPDDDRSKRHAKPNPLKNVAPGTLPF